MSLLPNPRVAKNALSKIIISLHTQGFILDYTIHEHHLLLCIQDNTELSFQLANVRLISQYYDRKNSCFTYIHTVEAPCGSRGLLLSDGICI